jgi:hypothetical protein
LAVRSAQLALETGAAMVVILHHGPTTELNLISVLAIALLTPVQTVDGEGSPGAGG